MQKNLEVNTPQGHPLGRLVAEAWDSGTEPEYDFHTDLLDIRVNHSPKHASAPIGPTGRRVSSGPRISLKRHRRGRFGFDILWEGLPKAVPFKSEL